MKILVMGLPGAGKTWFSERLNRYINKRSDYPDCIHFDNDTIMKNFDENLSGNYAYRHARRMRTYADLEVEFGKIVICNIPARLKMNREIIDPDIIVWLDTKSDDRVFEKPEKVDFVIRRKIDVSEVNQIARCICDNFLEENETEVI